MKKHRTKSKLIHTLLVTCMFLLVSCQSSKSPLPTVSHVDLESFMGTWYVIGYTPIIFDGNAHNATEHYYLKSNGNIQTTYQYRNGSFDGPLKTFRPTGFVHNKETNSEWRMQFVWPFKAAYLIVHYDEEKGETIIGHPSRKYAWIMLREPEYEMAVYERLLKKLVDLGYDPELIRRLPQDWSSEQLRKKMIQEAAPQAISKKAWREQNK